MVEASRNAISVTYGSFFAAHVSIYKLHIRTLFWAHVISLKKLHICCGLLMFY